MNHLLGTICSIPQLLGGFNNLECLLNFTKVYETFFRSSLNLSKVPRRFIKLFELIVNFSKLIFSKVPKLLLILLVLPEFLVSFSNYSDFFKFRGLFVCSMKLLNVLLFTYKMLSEFPEILSNLSPEILELSWTSQSFINFVEIPQTPRKFDAFLWNIQSSLKDFFSKTSRRFSKTSKYFQRLCSQDDFRIPQKFPNFSVNSSELLELFKLS